MRRAEPVYFWEADVEIVVRNLALSLQVEDRREGARTVRVFREANGHKRWWNDRRTMAKI